MPAKSPNLNAKSKLRIFKEKMLFKYMEKKSDESKLTQKQICIQLGFLESTIERYRDDIIMDSPYNRKKHRKKNNKSNSSINQTPTRSKIEILKIIIKK